jgi:hypothetical protein
MNLAILQPLPPPHLLGLAPNSPQFSPQQTIVQAHIITYCGSMNSLPDITTGKITLLIGPDAEWEMMQALTAVLALRGSVRILDSGNRFDPYQIARKIRHHTHQLDEALHRITIARAFTCHQVVALLADTTTAPTPQLVLDLLATFCDENASITEAVRLLKQLTRHLQRLSQHASIIISVRPPPQPNRAGFITLLMNVADDVHIRE